VWSGYFNPTHLQNSSARAQWVNQMIQTVQNTYTDGINFDIEDVIEAGSPLIPLLTTLTQETYAAFKTAIPGSQVSFDVAWSPNCIDVRCYDYYGLAQATDFLVMMDYDEQSQIFSGPCIAQSNSPPNLMLSGTAAFMDLGIPGDKLVLGLPWFGINYTCVNQTNATVCPIPYVPFRGVNCSDAAGSEIAYSVIMDQLLPMSTNGIQWDPISLSPWFNYKMPNGHSGQVWFDNGKSISIKVSLAIQLNLRGLAMWNADYLDYSDPVLVAEMWGALNNFFD
jgi:di-N-acetylchitobiase